MIPQRRPSILISNDDGVYSPGLLAAVEAVYDLGHVTIAAPLSQQTAMGRARSGNPDDCLRQVTLNSKGARYEAFTCEAAPARVIDHCLKVMPGYVPDFVISGINYGENLGSNITSSGTVGAAIEGACRGIPSIAMSLETPVDNHHEYTEQNWDAAMYFLRHFMKLAIAKGFPEGAGILKIDVPSSASSDTPWRLTRVSNNFYYKSLLPRPSLSSRLGDIVFSKGSNEGEPDNTDIYALAVDQVVSVTPLVIDLTAHDSFASFHDWAGGPDQTMQKHQ